MPGSVDADGHCSQLHEDSAHCFPPFLALLNRYITVSNVPCGYFGKASFFVAVAFIVFFKFYTTLMLLSIYSYYKILAIFPLS